MATIWKICRPEVRFEEIPGEVQDDTVCGNIVQVMIEPIAPPLSPDDPPISWSEVLERHGRWLRLVILARLRDRHAVDEVMQEVALAAVAQKAPLQDRDKLCAWLRQLAVRQALLYRRSRGRRHRLIERHAARSVGFVETDPLDWLVRDERSTLVRTALDRLPSRDAEILLLKYLENWSYRDLARHLDLSTSAVEARLHRARARLRHELASSQDP